MVLSCPTGQDGWMRHSCDLKNSELWLKKAFCLSILSCCTGSCLSLLLKTGAHSVGSAAERIGSWWAKYTGLCVWCWQNYTELCPWIPPLSHLVAHLPTQFATEEIFLLGSTNYNPSWSVYSLMSSEIINKWHLNSGKEPWGQIWLQLYHSKPSCLTQMKCWLIKEEQVIWGRSEHWWFFCSSVHDFRLETTWMFFYRSYT